MHFFTIFLFLSLSLMTQATDLSSELNQSPLSESVYVFVVTSDAGIDDIKASFGVTGPPRHSFRVIGENTYYFVLVSNSTTALRQLTFPSGSTVIQYPVAHLEEYFKMIGIDTGFEENDTEEALPDTILTFAEWEYDFPKGTPVKLFDLMMSGLGKEAMLAHKNVKRALYNPIAYYPPKLLAFLSANDNTSQRIVKNVQDVLGGIGILIVKNKHIVKV